MYPHNREFEYLPIEQAKVGNIVEALTNENCTTRGKLYQIMEGSTNGSIGHFIKDSGKLSEGIRLNKRRWKLVKTKPASKAKVGDLMFRVSSGTSVFPQYSIKRITSICSGSSESRTLNYGRTLSVIDYEAVILCEKEQDEPTEQPIIGQTNQTQTKEEDMIKTNTMDLALLLDMLIGNTEEEKNAINSRYVGIMTRDGEYLGYVYFDDKLESEQIMAQPSNEGCKLHIFRYERTIAQEPRKIIEVDK